MKKKIIILICILWISLIIIDFIRFKSNESEPIICLYKNQFSNSDGEYQVNYGVGYSFSREEIYYKGNGGKIDIDLYSTTHEYFKLFYFIPIEY